MKNSVISATLALMMAGCSSTTPAISEYTILPLNTVQNPLNAPAHLSLRIIQAKSIASLASKELCYLREPAQTGTYLYSRWSDTPASMINRSLVSSLQNRRLFAALIPAASNASAELTLESDLHAFYHRFHKDGSSEGYLDITYRLITTADKKVIASKRFVIASPAASANAEGGVNALNDATRDLSRDTALWLESISKEKQWIK